MNSNELPNECFCCLATIENASHESLRRYRVGCPNCGDYIYHDTPLSLHFKENLRRFCSERIALAHRIRRMSLLSPYPMVGDALIQEVLDQPSLPPPTEQPDNLIVHLGKDERSSPGRFLPLSVYQWQIIIGAQSEEGAEFIIRSMRDERLIEVKADIHLALTLEGWRRFDGLMKARVESKKAFMAMPFSDDRINQAFMCFQGSVRETGFALHKADTEPKSGLIDDHIRVGILTSRFLIADLTGGNNGAYWEAGFAEGLRRPVIYTCHSDEFESRGTHFDTRNRRTIKWHEDRLTAAAHELKATIRATLPDEAIFED